MSNVLSLNEELIKTQNCEENREAILKLHVKRNTIVELMEVVDDMEFLKLSDKKLDELEIELQKLWKFPKNKNYIAFWRRPKCNCPSMDNEDAYPTGYYYRSSNCILHGDTK